MKIVSNACNGAYYYKKYLNMSYNVPFIWNRIQADDMLKLIHNYDTINFRNIKSILIKDYIIRDEIEKRDIPDINTWNTITGLCVDNTFNVFFSHNIYDPACETPTISGTNVRYKHNYKLTYDNWLRRVDRMEKCTEEPIFFIITHQKQKYTLDKCKEILNTNRKIVMITEFVELKKYESDRIQIFIVKSTDAGPQFLMDSIKDFKISI